MDWKSNVLHFFCFQSQCCCMQHLCMPACPLSASEPSVWERKIKHNKGSGDQRSDIAWKETKTQHRLFWTTLVLQRLVTVQNSDCCFGFFSHFALTFQAWCVNAWAFILQDMSQNSGSTIGASAGTTSSKMDWKCHIFIMDVAKT